MEQFDNEVFGFGNDTNEEFEQTNDFNYDSISGLGESDYENEDLFSPEVTNESSETEFITDFRIGDFDTEIASNEEDDESGDEIVTNIEEFKIEDNDLEEELKGEEIFTFENEEPVTEETPVVEEPVVEETKEEIVETPEVKEESSIEISQTPIEELNKLTQFEEENIEKTDINALFDRVSVNVQDASEIFRKNTDLKQKIDTRFDELKKLQSEIENSRKKQLDEINEYKEEVLSKLTEKKEEIEKRLNLLKESQATLEKEKQEFEEYKKKEQENIDKVQKEVQSAYDDRREELSHIEDVLRKQKDSLDEERSQLSLDRIQYESDKNELANNLLKFNELVNSFTSGVSDIKE